MFSFAAVGPCLKMPCGAPRSRYWLTLELGTAGAGSRRIFAAPWALTSSVQRCSAHGPLALGKGPPTLLHGPLTAGGKAGCVYNWIGSAPHRQCETPLLLDASCFSLWRLE